MKFKINTNGNPINVLEAEQALVLIDAAAIIDIDREDSSLRISTCLDDTKLASVITKAGFPISKQMFKVFHPIAAGDVVGNVIARMPFHGVQASLPIFFKLFSIWIGRRKYFFRVAMI